MTGLGSLDVAKLLEAAAGGGAGSTGSFTLAANPSTLSVTPVANTTSTSVWTLTAASVSGFTGAVVLGCTVTPASSQAPTCSVTPGSVNLAAGGTGTATIAVVSVGPTNNCLVAAARTGWLGGSSGAALAGLLVVLLPVRRRRGLRGLVLVCALAAGVWTLGGCSGSTTTAACSNVVSAGTSAGTYTVTVTGTSGALTATAPVALTVTVN